MTKAILEKWMVAQKRHRLSDKQVQMARELGLNPDKLGKIDNHKQEAWKAPLPQFIESWKSHSTLPLLATQDLPTFLYYMIDPLKSWCWGAILFYPFKNSRFS